MSGAMRRKVSAVRVAEAAERRRSIYGESLTRDGTEQWAGQRSAVIGETD